MWRVVVLVCLVESAVGQGGWWGNAVYYRILVDSFKDGDGDGLGDLRGMYEACKVDIMTSISEILNAY